MSALSVGIVGCGLIAGGPVRDGRVILGNHAAACREVEGVMLLAAAEPDEARRLAFGKEWGVTQLYESAEAMFRAEQLDLAIVCTPPSSHEGVCTAALRAGVRGISCEKPFTGSALGASRVAQACREVGCRLVVNFSRRWDTSHRDLAARIARGEIGEVRTVFFSYTGTIRGNGSHGLDTLRMLVPGAWKVESVGCSGEKPGAPPVDDGPLDAVLVHESGARAFVAPVRDAQYFVFEFYVFGTKGRARLVFQGNDIRIDSPQPDASYPGYLYLKEAAMLPTMTLPNTFAGSLRELARAVRDARDPDVPTSEYVASLALLDSLVAHATEKTR